MTDLVLALSQTPDHDRPTSRYRTGPRPGCKSMTAAPTWRVSSGKG